MSNSIKSTTAWFIISATVVIVFGGALTWANVTAPSDASDTSIIAPATTTATTTESTATTATTTGSTATTGTTATDELADWKTYTNNTYGFSLTFTDPWKGYKVKEVDLQGTIKTFYITVPTTDSFYATASDHTDAGYAAPSAISIINKSDWTGSQEQSMDFGTKIGEKGNYVFTSSQWQACPSDLCDSEIVNTIKTVVASFKLN